MKIIIKHLETILTDPLSTFDRGVLITAILTKDDDPAIAFAKFKAKIKYNREVKKSLLKLHDNDYIIFSQYDKVKAMLNKTKDLETAGLVIDFYNNLLNKNVSKTSVSSTRHLLARLKEFSVEDCKLVIANRYDRWHDDDFMKQYLTLETIFSPSKFEKYLDDARTSGKGEGTKNIIKLKIKQGEEITPKKVTTFNDKDTYNVKISSVEGGKPKSSIIRPYQGKGLKIAVKLAHSQKEVLTRFFYEGKL